MRWSLSSLTPRQRARVAVAALLVVSCGNLYLIQDVAQFWRRDPDAIWEPDPYIQRLAAVRRFLPPDAWVGYVNPTYENVAQHKRDLFVTRYALAPACVVETTDLALVLVGGESSTALESSLGPELVEGGGTGFRLHRGAPP